MLFLPGERVSIDMSVILNSEIIVKVPNIEKSLKKNVYPNRNQNYNLIFTSGKLFLYTKYTSKLDCHYKERLHCILKAYPRFYRTFRIYVRWLYFRIRNENII